LVSAIDIALQKYCTGMLRHHLPGFRLCENVGVSHPAESKGAKLDDQASTSLSLTRNNAFLHQLILPE